MSASLRDFESESDISPVCELCGVFENLRICGSCKGAWYCSKEHQKFHWKTHKTACKKKVTCDPDGSGSASSTGIKTKSSHSSGCNIATTSSGIGDTSYAKLLTGAALTVASDTVAISHSATDSVGAVSSGTTATGSEPDTINLSSLATGGVTAANSSYTATGGDCSSTEGLIKLDDIRNVSVSAMPESGEYHDHGRALLESQDDNRAIKNIPFYADQSLAGTGFDDSPIVSSSSTSTVPLNEEKHKMTIGSAKRKTPSSGLQSDDVFVKPKPPEDQNNNRDNKKGKRHRHQLQSGESSLSQPMVATKEETKLADYMVKCLTDYGMCVVDNFMGNEKGDMIIDEVHALETAGRFNDGQTVSEAAPGKKIRGDKISWVEKGDPQAPHIGMLIQRLDTLMVVCNGRLGRYKINGRTKAMAACYPGDGTGYKRHVDNPNGDGRCVTCIYYLNKSWDVQKNGGLLRIFPVQFNQVADIEPKFDRLLFFWSDRRNPHEVQPAYETRYALTVWYFDAEERKRAKIRYSVNAALAASSQPEGQQQQELSSQVLSTLNFDKSQ